MSICMVELRAVQWCEGCHESSMSTDFEAGGEECDRCFEESHPKEFAEWVKECEGEQCVKCNKSTAMGKGLFVNRIPAFTDKLDGYMCIQCQELNEEEEGDR